MKSSLKNSFVLTGVLILSGFGCRKDPQIPDNTPVVPDPCMEEICAELPPSPELGWTYTEEGPQFITPCYNPANADEFIYLRRGTAVNAELIKYNLVTKTEQVLCNTVSIATRPHWGRQGWITFSTTDWTVWKIRDDGTQLTQLTFGVNDQFPIFTYDGSKIIYARMKNYTNFELSNDPSLYDEYKMVVIDLDGNPVDSVMAQDILPGNHYQKWTQATALENGQIYFVGGSGPSAGFYCLEANLDTINPEPIESLYPNTGFVKDLNSSNGFLYYTKFKGCFSRVEIASGHVTDIRVGCDTRWIDFFSVSPENDKVLMQKVTRTVYGVNSEAINEQNDIWIFNLNTCSAEKVIGE